jgi:predicted GNAT family acetyltransferase
MELKNEYNERNGTFYLEENGKREAEMTYVFAGPAKFIIDHTEVFEGNEGKGLGKQLVNAAVVFAREKQMKIAPVCQYAKSVMEKTPAYADVLF